jgi:phosphorylated CTD-interacting factor 1
MLARYRVLSEFQNGSQASISTEVWLPLWKHFDVEAECFANPLNRSNLKYCSLFGDSDQYFGSSGSFFSFYPTTGSFQVNPPFDPETVSATLEHIAGLLEKSDEPLNFCLIVPFGGSKQTEHLKEMMKSYIPDHGYNIIETEGVKSERVWFMQGLQHDRGYFTSGVEQSKQIGMSFPANCPTQVVFFQNEAGRARWPMTSEIGNEIVSAFRVKPDPDLFKTTKSLHVDYSREEKIALLDSKREELLRGERERRQRGGDRGCTVVVSNVEAGTLVNAEAKVEAIMARHGILVDRGIKILEAGLFSVTFASENSARELLANERGFSGLMGRTWYANAESCLANRSWKVEGEGEDRRVLVTGVPVGLPDAVVKEHLMAGGFGAVRQILRGKREAGGGETKIVVFQELGGAERAVRMKEMKLKNSSVRLRFRKCTFMA